MIASTSEHRTWAHGLPAGAKFAALLASTAAVLWTDSVPALAAILAAAAGLYLSGGRGFAAQGLRALRGILIVAAVIGLWHAVALSPGSAARVVLRLVIAVALANFVTMTTRVGDMTALFDSALAALRLPARHRRRIALAMALTIRFIPVLGDKAARLSEAFRARSRRRLSPKLVLPLSLLAIDDAEHVAEALRARSGTD